MPDDTSFELHQINTDKKAQDKLPEQRQKKRNSDEADVIMIDSQSDQPPHASKELKEPTIQETQKPRDLAQSTSSSLKVAA